MPTKRTSHCTTPSGGACDQGDIPIFANFLMTIPRSRLALHALLAFLAASLASAQPEAKVELSAKGQVFTFQHPLFSMEVDAKNGGRILSWKSTGEPREWVNRPDGMLADSFFADSSYRGAILYPGPDHAVLRLVSEHPSGLKITRTITVSAAKSGAVIGYRLENPLQAPFRGKTANALAFREATLELMSPASKTITTLVRDRELPGGMAITHGVEDGIEVLKEPGAVSWTFPEVEEGTVRTWTVTLTPFSDNDLSDGLDVRHPASVISPIANWRKDAAYFPITESHKRRGFWLSAGQGASRAIISSPVELDLARDDARFLSIDLNILEDRNTTVRVKVPSRWQNRIKAFLEQAGHERVELAPLSDDAVALKAGLVQRVWLSVDGGSEPGEFSVPLKILVGEAAETVELHVTVWDLPRPTARPFHVRGYGSGIEYWNGGSAITPETSRRLGSIFKTYSDMGGDVFEWMVSMKGIAAHVKLRESGETLASVVSSNPERLDLKDLPALDFSHYDPWLESAKKFGITRVETYLSLGGESSSSWRFFVPLIGKDRVQLGSPEAAAVTVWYLTQLREYFTSHGFENLFCKIGDEIGVEQADKYIDSAKLARAAGWRPFTTISGMMARTVGEINRLNPHCDQWQLGMPAKDDFLDLLRSKVVVKEKRFDMPAWDQRAISYRNGGAMGTYGVETFGPKGFTRLSPRQVESVVVLEDGKPLLFSSASPWANQLQGRVFSAGAFNSHLYISPSGGDHPSKHRYELLVRIREKSEDGDRVAKIDASDEIWYYTGRPRPYLTPYETAWAMPMMAPYQKFEGYGIWAFWEWNSTERIVWMNDDDATMSISPAYCGYRDGWRDAILFAEAAGGCGADGLQGVMGQSGADALHVDLGERADMPFLEVRNSGDPGARNLARRRALEQLIKEKK